ncbi:MAG: preprotein translocase subunit YajC [candidate division WOR-3 bacterium]|jgi:preprotein translocase subunit YajC
MQENTGANWLSLLIFYLLIFLVFYLILILPQQRERKRKEQMIKNIKKGDKVITTSGIIGEVTIIGDDYFIIESEGSAIKIKKWAINEVIK